MFDWYHKMMSLHNGDTLGGATPVATPLDLNAYANYDVLFA